MSRRRKHARSSATSPTSSPLANTPQPALPVSVLVQRILLGLLTVLVVSRPLVAGADPGRLSLLSSGTEMTFNFGVLLLLLITAVGRIFDRSAAGRIEWGPLLLVGVGVVCYISGQQPDRYARPAIFHAWEWCSLAAILWLVRRIPRTERDSRSLLNALLASVISIAVLGIYQAATKPLALPNSELPAPRLDLAGNDEFYPELNGVPLMAGPRGTFDQPQTFALFMLLFLPVSLLLARTAWPLGTRYRLAVLLPAAMFLAFVFAALQSSWSGQVWSVGWSLFREQPWWGIGPGNFSRHSPDHVANAGGWLTFAATTGIVGVALLILFVFAVARSARQSVPSDEVAPPPRVRWEFYYGGIVGLLVGFVAATAEVPIEASSDEVFRLGAVAVGRALVWFVAFGTLESIRPRWRSLAQTLLAGAVLVLLAGIVSSAVLLPTILFPTVVVIGVALNGRTIPPPRSRAWSQPLAVATAANAAVVFVLYLLSAAIPAWGTASTMRQVRLASMFYADKDRQIDLAANRVERANALTEARNYLRATMTIPLRSALRQDQNNTALMLEIARWQRPLYRYQTLTDPKAAADTARDNLKLGDAASKMDPHNLAGPRSLYESLLTFQKEAGVNVKPRERLEAINKQIARLATVEPQQEVPLRYRMVHALFDGGDLVGVEAEVTRLFRLLRVEGSPHGTLNQEQRINVIDRAKKSLTQLPPELLEEWVN